MNRIFKKVNNTRNKKHFITSSIVMINHQMMTIQIIRNTNNCPPHPTVHPPGWAGQITRSGQLFSTIEREAGTRAYSCQWPWSPMYIIDRCAPTPCPSCPSMTSFLCNSSIMVLQIAFFWLVFRHGPEIIPKVVSRVKLIETQLLEKIRDF